MHAFSYSLSKITLTCAKEARFDGEGPICHIQSEFIAEQEGTFIIHLTYDPVLWLTEVVSLRSRGDLLHISYHISSKWKTVLSKYFRNVDHSTRGQKWPWLQRVGKMEAVECLCEGKSSQSAPGPQGFPRRIAGFLLDYEADYTFLGCFFFLMGSFNIQIVCYLQHLLSNRPGMLLINSIASCYSQFYWNQFDHWVVENQTQTTLLS